MLNLTAKEIPGTDIMEVTIEFGGMPSRIEEELEAILFNLYKRAWKNIGPDFMKRMCKSTTNAVERITMEVVTDGKL